MTAPSHAMFPVSGPMAEGSDYDGEGGGGGSVAAELGGGARASDSDEVPAAPAAHHRGLIRRC